MGACGAAMGVPIAVSLLMSADYTKPRERKSVLDASASAVIATANLPAGRCCKASVYSSLDVGTTYLIKELGIEATPMSSPICQFKEHNPECLKMECPFFGQSSSNGDM